jgi:hypothetical protein
MDTEQNHKLLLPVFFTYHNMSELKIADQNELHALFSALFFSTLCCV